MILDELVQRITDRPKTVGRFVVAIAGPPAAGKTTLAAQLHDALPATTAVLGLDAFHFDDIVLNARGDRARKGAPFTFDVEGYRRCLETLVTETSDDVAIPVFDRELEVSRNAAAVVPSSCEVIITEGNYLLLDDEPWSGLAPLFDLTVFLDVNEATVHQRIIDRWLNHGLSAADTERRAETNDLPNARLVLTNSRPADLTASPHDL